MTSISHLLLSTFLLVSILSTGVQAEEFVGLVKSLEGNAVIIRDGQSRDALEGMEIKKGDIIRTGNNGAIGLIFSDDTVISMGPRTELAVEDYLFEPIEGKLGFIARILKGTVSYLSGQISKLAPESVKLMTPAATIGVRGTHVLVKVD